MTTSDAAPDIPRATSYDALKHRLLPREREAHKGDFGHVLIIGGDAGYGGAVLMAGQAAARVGAGLTSIATHPDHINGILARQPELMARGIADVNHLVPLLKRASVLVLGPGLGQSAWSIEVFTKVLESQAAHPLPIIVDADALNLLSHGICSDLLEPDVDNRQWVLTPHPGEAARLLGIESMAVQADRITAVQTLQACWGGVCILKGAGTLISARAGFRPQLSICSDGNPGMASGGMGDVLSGVLGGLVA
ncbi:MAG: NAD(P)H-hydrate dehydratase, partial [Pseudomonadales bacterium]|nr:NAD(P)H-hydrate dehydratase [Pseudomonadales bacterium]